MTNETTDHRVQVIERLKHLVAPEDGGYADTEEFLGKALDLSESVFIDTLSQMVAAATPITCDALETHLKKEYLKKLRLVEGIEFDGKNSSTFIGDPEDGKDPNHAVHRLKNLRKLEIPPLEGVLINLGCAYAWRGFGSDDYQADFSRDSQEALDCLDAAKTIALEGSDAHAREMARIALHNIALVKVAKQKWEESPC
jgi:hypothetical protein